MGSPVLSVFAYDQILLAGGEAVDVNHPLKILALQSNKPYESTSYESTTQKGHQRRPFPTPTNWEQ